MKALFTGQDYMLILDKQLQEFQGLRQGRLEASLTDQEEDTDLGKLVSLELADNNGSDGIEVKYLPEDAQTWEAIKGVQVKMNERAYNHVRDRGKFGTRYDGLGNKIEIFNGDPRVDF